jgi:Fanconi anemia group J protein
VGGKQSKYGAHDIEDLVDFGVNPYIQKDIALYRKEPTESFGLSLRGEAGRKSGGGSFVREVKRDTPADMNGSIIVGDKIIRVNGTDVSKSTPATVVATIKGVQSDPLLLDVSRGGTGTLSSSLDDGYSSRSACPYYLSQILSKDADIIFAPYNYVLDPGIRKALGLELGNSVVILDEAHNVESTLREAGSGKWGEFELCELLVMLNNYAITERSTTNLIDIGQDGGGILSTDNPLEVAYVCDVAHTLLMFVETVVEKLRTDRTCFQNNPGKRGAANALVEWEKFHTQDDNEFEVTFVGPTGKGINGKCVGCLPFFEGLGITKVDLDGLVKQVEAFEKHVRGREGDAGTTERDKIANLVERLIDLVVKLNAAIQTPEHFYAAVLATANGSLEFAKNGDVGESESGGRFKRKPRALPFIPPRTSSNPGIPANPCINSFCRAKCIDVFNPIRHGDFCNGSTPRWEAHLHLDLLTPGPLMQELSNECRTVVLASGSLAPIPSLCAELNLFPADGLSPVKPSQPDPTISPPKIQKRLQNQPTPLEAGHVVDLDKQLMAVSIGHFPDGSELRVAQKNYSQPEFLHKLGDCLVRIVEGIAEGGVLVFLPSYALLRKCERLWNPDGFRRQSSRRAWWQQEDESDDGPSVFDRLKAIKHNVIVEPSGDQDAFEVKRQEYMETVRTKGGCVLLAVFRGKMSEGISFNDNNARGVVCIGLPLPSAFALPIKVKMDYNEEQRKLRNRTDLLPGREWYNQQAYRAVAQALGRCIRHAADYGAIFLLDIRHCDDGSPNNGVPEAHKNLPKWMRHTVKNLSKHAAGNGNSMFNYVSSSNTVWGGWPGMKKELSRFFKQAKSHTNEVLVKQRDKIAAANKSNVVHTFNVRTNKWSEEKSEEMPQAQPEISPAQENNYVSKIISIDTTPNQTSRTKSTQAHNPSSSNNGNSSGSSQSAKKGSLQEMFKKQHEESVGSQKPRASSTTKSKKAKNTHNTLKAMFEKQQVAATEACAVKTPTQEENMDDDEDATMEQSPDEQTIAPQTKVTTPMNNTFSFKRSPFANNTSTPTSEEASGTSELCLSSEMTGPSQHQDTTEIGSPEEDERLCIVCEDAKKEVILLPCKHMCLCKNCASTCLFKTLHECPMCRAMIGDSMEVYW